MTSPEHIGIVACSAEGAALCYRTICLEAIPVLGEHTHPEITMDSIPMVRHMDFIRKNDWAGVAELMLVSLRRVAAAGAKFAICPDNTIHQAFRHFPKDLPIPWLPISEVVVSRARQLGYNEIGVLGTKYLMEGPVYAEVFAKNEISMRIPDSPDRIKINDIIFKELVNGIFLDSSRAYLDGVIADLANRGCDAVVLGCTELPLILPSSKTSLPTLDSTRLLAKAALDYSLRNSR
jgi:aspartate racemase